MKKIIVANWKANPAEEREITQYFSKFNPKTSAEIVFCPPFIYLKDFAKNNFLLGAQDCFWENKGAFTGEITPIMLKNIGCGYVIIGHSERRNIFGETNQAINAKIKQAIAQDLKVIYCIGEKENEDYKVILKEQLENGLKDIDLDNIIIAYEPIWAIGTGKSCDVNIVKEIKQYILSIIKKEIPVLYGGSVNPENAKEFLDNMDGLLVGGASLDPKNFEKICSLAN